ncbi:MAG: M14 family metallopeptidase [Acidobacteriota bacterium]
MRRRSGFIALVLISLAVLSGQAQTRLTSPEEFFGFRLGSDRKMARWEKLVDYYRLLEREGGGKLKCVEMGPTTMGNPFLLVIISSSANLARLEKIRQGNNRISDPRGLPEQEAKKLVAEGRAVVCQSMSLHATEIGGAQMAPELAYDLLSRQDKETRQILDNVVFLLVPSFNPDGLNMVADWYARNIGTEFEGGPLPWLYHKYAGHDNNRDAFQLNLVESQYMARILFTDWMPQAYVDHHHMGSYGARIYVPPYAEPVRPHADPLVWRELSWYGAHVACKEEEAGMSGVLNMAQYSGWGHFGFHWVTPFHNITGMLTESASAKVATPIFIHPDQLRGGTRGLPAYEEQTTFPNPWPGGWWRLRDIVDRQKIAAWAILDHAARNRETVLWNAYLKARRQTERGVQGKPAAYIISADQHDRVTAIKMVLTLVLQGIEVRQARSPFVTAAGVSYPAGSYIVSMEQPKMGLIRYLLGRTFYPDNDWTRAKDGSPIRPYDMATDTMHEFMGVRVDPVDQLPVAGELAKLERTNLTGMALPPGKIDRGSAAFVLDGRLNNSFLAVNLLLDQGRPVHRVDKPSNGLRPGDFLVPAAPEPLLAGIAARTGVDFKALKSQPGEGTHEVKRLRTGMYQRYRGGNMDEGWTRLVLEQFAIPYTPLLDAEIKKGTLNAEYDAIILPDDSTFMLTGDKADDRRDEGRGATRWREEVYPPEYRSGFGKEGVEALKAFVQNGGTLVALGRSSDFAIEKLQLPVRNVVANRPAKEFFCPGSTLRARFDTGNPLAYGMPAEGFVLFFYSPAFEIIPNEFNERYEAIATYADRDILQSGWLIGGEALARKPAMIAAGYGQGKVILIGFRTQHRAQTHGTFKLLFNALLR